MDTNESSRQDEEGALSIPTNTPAIQIMSNYNNEPAMHDLYQFISNSGSFNLDQLKGDLIMHWGEELNIQKFIVNGNGRLVQNEDLGVILSNLYN